MQGEKLKEYVFSILNLEAQKRTLESAQYYLEKKKDQLQTVSHVRPPELREVKVKADESGSGAAVLMLCLIGLFGIFLALSGVIMENSTNIALGLVLFFLGLGGIAGLQHLIQKEAEEKEQKAKEAADREYAQNYELYQQQIFQERQQNKRELAKIEPDLQAVNTMLQKVDSQLAAYYGLDIIHPSYRNIVPVASFCHYLSTGICSQLKGPDGCYRLYENEVVQKLILSKLDQIIQQLEELNERQYELKEALLRSNKAIDNLTGYVRGVSDENRQHHAIMQYQQQCLQDEVKNHNLYERLRDMLKR